MALFKVSKGLKANLPSTKTDGYAYFCTDDGSFWIDYKDGNGVLQRKQIDAGTVSGHIVQIDVPADAKFTDTTYSVVTTSENGLMSSSDKTKLDGLQNGVTIVDTAPSASEIMNLEDGLYYFTNEASFYIYIIDSSDTDETTYVTNIYVNGLCKNVGNNIYVYDAGTYYYKQGIRTYDNTEYVYCPSEYAKPIWRRYAGMWELPIRDVVRIDVRLYDDGEIEYDSGRTPITYLRTFGFNASIIHTQCSIKKNNSSEVIELYEVTKIFGEDEFLTGIQYVGYKDGILYNALCEEDSITLTTEDVSIPKSAEDIGAVSYDVAQNLTDTQKSQARTNIGAGTSDFSGSYDDLSDLPYATCPTSTSTADKVATCSGSFTLTTGAMVLVKFAYPNTAASPTLNVNGTGAKSIMQYGTTAVSTYMWNYGAVVPFLYDGTRWIMVGGTLATTTYYGLTKLSSSYTTNSAAVAATSSAVYSVYNAAMLKSGGTFTGNVMAGSSYQAVGTSLLRNSKIVSSETDPTVNGEICWVYG